MTLRPATAQELFNLCHTMAQNVIKRIFSVLKKRFRILLLPPPLKMDDQARIPVALCALHNFIQKHDSKELQEFMTEPEIVDVERTGTLRTELPGCMECFEANDQHDRIAWDMWMQYQLVLQEQGL